ncbi:MarR family transcriptional regulator [Actinosynnema sp. ALI-1.44]|uniref:MarR family winged helix-turn-helix transcriptional regulator n=1 Tax=Actinosynnema sp. ALI-1.44 TaxID=1933779 RepID=UPI00097CB451|nr:MarR family transcriptional regulator [Actinosynnema sp. ALI-1.44]ONI70778.1 MarR family transcriptional regulator [Actinosynnema sp. ALI-1.44]
MTEPDPRDLLLDRQACFALYAASRAVTDVYRPLLAELDLTYPQYLVLLVLWERDNLPIKQIGSALHLDYGTVSPLLKRLETRGLVRRERQAGDERSVVVSLTADGIALRERALRIPPAIACAMGLDEQSLSTLMRLLRGITESARGAEPPQAEPPQEGEH